MNQSQYYTDWPDKDYFSDLEITPHGVLAVAFDGTPDPLLTNPTAQTFQSNTGQCYMILVDGTSLIWDTYFGDNSQMDFYWHGANGAIKSGTPVTFGKGQLAYNDSKSTFFISSTSGGDPVETWNHPAFLNQSVNSNFFTRQGDLNINSFYINGTSFLGHNTWGTMFGGNRNVQAPEPYAKSESDYLSEIISYDHLGKSYILVASTSLSFVGSKTSNVEKFPIADNGGWFRQKNFTSISSIPKSDFMITRFYITNIQQGDISTSEHLVNHNFKVFPIPASDEIWIISNQFTIESVDIISMSGRVVSKRAVTENTIHKIKYNLSDLAPGVYFIRVNDSAFRKIIKQ